MLVRTDLKSHMLMSKPTSASDKAVKRIVRFLAHRPRLVWKYHFQQVPEELVVFSDANLANCRRRSRKNTSGGCITYGSHLLRFWSNTQATVALSSGESETLAAIRAGTEALGMMALLSGLGVHTTSTLRLDASAALGILQRKGMGKMRHLNVGCLWLQEKEAREQLRLAKEPGETNRQTLGQSISVRK